METLKKGTFATSVAALVLLSATFPASPASVRSGTNKTDNVRLLKRFRFQGGLELAFARGRVFASQWNGHTDRYQNPKRGGVHIFSATRRSTKKIGFLHCPGADNDVARLSRRLIAVGYQENECGNTPGTNGILLARVKRPRHPRVLSSVPVFGAHTITVYPRKPIIYASPAGWNQRGREDIVDVSDPRRPKVVGSFEPPGFACHDIRFYTKEPRKLAFCPQVGGGEVQIWDVTDPLKPEVIGHIVNESIQYGHTAMASPDGDLLVINDEAFVSHECESGNSPTGRVWFYDISNPETPILLGSFAPPRGKEGVGFIAGWIPSYCTSALIDFVPRTRFLITSWYTGGVNVLDLTDPTAPEEIAYYQPGNALAYGVGWHRGRVYVNDINRGLEVLRIRGIRPPSRPPRGHR